MDEDDYLGSEEDNEEDAGIEREGDEELNWEELQNPDVEDGDCDEEVRVGAGVLEMSDGVVWRLHAGRSIDPASQRGYTQPARLHLHNFLACLRSMHTCCVAISSPGWVACPSTSSAQDWCTRCSDTPSP